LLEGYLPSFLKWLYAQIGRPNDQRLVVQVVHVTSHSYGYLQLLALVAVAALEEFVGTVRTFNSGFGIEESPFNIIDYYLLINDKTELIVEDARDSNFVFGGGTVVFLTLRFLTRLLLLKWILLVHY